MYHWKTVRRVHSCAGSLGPCLPLEGLSFSLRKEAEVGCAEEREGLTCASTELCALCFRIAGEKSAQSPDPCPQLSLHQSLTPLALSAIARFLLKFRVFHSSSLNTMGWLQLFQRFCCSKKGAKRLAVEFRWKGR